MSPAQISTRLTRPYSQAPTDGRLSRMYFHAELLRRTRFNPVIQFVILLKVAPHFEGNLHRCGGEINAC
jgi:hypothetical protein